MKYPKSYLEEITQRLKVSDVVGSAVKLTKRGKEFVGLSPFANEKTPSFTVNDEKGFYHCFSSGEHGGIFDFLTKVEKLTFGDAVRRLASKAGMAEYKFSKTDVETEKKVKRSEKIFQLFFNYCYKNIFTEENKMHLDYLLNRSLKKPTIEAFQIGFCDDGNRASNHFLKLGYQEKELIETGLFYLHEQRKVLIPRFKNRIIFPIKNLFGEFIGCGGRTVLSSVPAKYINSPETIFFKKGSNLYNFNLAKSENKNTDYLLIVEGYMDVVSLYNHGIQNVCASLGTAITDNQINLAWRNFKNIIICFDGDRSGFAAAYRAAEKLLKISKPNHTVSFMIMPQGLDPDDYVNKFGKDGFTKLTNKKKDITDFVFEYTAKQLKDYTASSLAELEKKLMDITDTIEDLIIKKYYKNYFKNKIFENLIKKNKNKLNKFQVANSFDMNRLEMSEQEVKEFSLCHLLLKFPEFSEKNIEKISEIDLTLRLTKEIRTKIVDILLSGNNCSSEKMKNILIEAKIKNIETFLKFSDTNSSIDSIDIDTFVNLVEDYESQLRIMQKNKKIEQLEKSFSSNMSEQAFNELISLKNSNNL
jgi:DNA primase